MRFKYTEFPTDVYGLKFKPSIDSHMDTQDWISHGWFGDQLVDMTSKHSEIKVEFSDRNKSVLVRCLDELLAQDKLHSILEIGVFRSGNVSSTKVILDKKPLHTKYFGIDLNEGNLSPIRNPEANVFCFCTNSSNIEYILHECKTRDTKTFDFILIDGNHSINQVMDDWRFTEFLNPGGICLFHDTSYHPGPSCVYEAVDEKLFEKTKYFQDVSDDWGVATFKKL